MKPLFVMLAVLPFLSACNQPESPNAELFPAAGAENVNPDTHLVLTFTDSPIVGDSGMIRIYDAMSHQIVDSLDLSIPSGPTESRTYGPECDYTKIPYDYTRTHMPTNRDTRPGTPLRYGRTYPTRLPTEHHRWIYRCVSFPSHHRARFDGNHLSAQQYARL